MFQSLKIKFFLAFSTLIIVLIGAVGLFLVNSKAQELYAGVANSTGFYVKGAAEDVITAYEHNLLVGNFFGFNASLNNVLKGNVYVDSISVANYRGVILYDYKEEATEQYSGTIRTISDQETLARVQSNYNSMLLEDGRVLYLTTDSLNRLVYIDENENEIEGRGAFDKIVNVLVPYNNEYAVFFTLNYDAIRESLLRSELQILVVVGVGLVLSLMVSFMLSVSISGPLKALKQGAVKIAAGDFSARVQVKTKDEVGVLAGTFNKMAEDLAISTKAIVYKERVQKELELASQIQADLLPKKGIEQPTFDVSGGLVPASEIGGDVFDYIPMNSGRYMVYLGDVTGHGVPAGIISSITDALLYSMRDKEDMRDVIKTLNDIMMKKTTAKVFMTMALVLWDASKDTAYYVNAGHPPILHYDSAQRKVVEINLPGVALGLTERLEDLTKMQKVEMKGNDVIVLYSDGVPEAMNANGEQYGATRLKRIVQDAANDLYTARGIKNAVLADVAEFAGEAEHKDDITVVVLKRKANG